MMFLEAKWVCLEWCESGKASIKVKRAGHSQDPASPAALLSGRDFLLKLSAILYNEAVQILTRLSA